MANRSSLYTLIATGLSLCGCEEVSDPVPDVKGQLAPVVGGQPVEVCQYPSTVMVGGCTGTLIHPRVVTTAAHCLSSSTATIRFGGNRMAPGSFTLMGNCRTGRGSGRGASADWGYCVIPEDDRVKQLPYTPPLVGCERERFLKVGASGWIVGYGTTGPEGRGGGVKRAVEVKINRIDTGTINVGDKDVGACHGDSGGPIYMQIGDGTNDWGLRVFGSTSRAGEPRCDCTCSTLYVDIAQHVAAIEANEMIDVTPCTDTDGRWAPGPECNALQTTPMSGSGTFPACTVPRTSAPITSCAGVAPTAGGAAPPTAGSGPRAGVGATAGANAAGGGGGGAAGSRSAQAGTSGASATAAGSGGQPSAGNTAAGAAGATLAGRPAAGTGGTSGPLIGTSGALGISAAGSAGIAPAVSLAPSPPRDSGCSLVSRSSRGNSAIAWLSVNCAVALVLRRRRRR